MVSTGKKLDSATKKAIKKRHRLYGGDQDDLGLFGLWKSILMFLGKKGEKNERSFGRGKHRRGEK